MEARVRNAICRISIMRDGREVERGTGALIADGLVLTALHVVGDRRADPPEPHPGECVLTFPGGQAKTRFDPARCDRLADWAVVPCNGSIDAEPIPLGDIDNSGVAWESFGFPDMNPVDGMVQTGSVENHTATYQKIRAYQLFSKQAAAGDGGPTSGMSGAPLIVDGAVVGLMRSALQQLGQTADGKAVRNTRGGTLYACPVSAPLEKLGDLLPLPDPCRGLPGLPRLPLPEEPFRYLHRFEEKDAEIFFGRNRDIREMYERITDPESPSILLLYGQSGVGKSSFLDAGVVPRLRGRREVCYLRREAGSTLIEALRRLLESLAAGQGTALDSDQDFVRLWRAVEEGAGKPLVVFYDQIEEVFTHRSRSSPPELEECFEALGPLRENEGKIQGTLILGFRKEWYPEIQKQLEQQRLDYGKVFLEPLDGDSVREAVVGLTSTARLRERYRLEVDPELPELISAQLLADPTSPVAPTLEVLLTKMWREATDRDSERPRFDKALYQSLQREGLLLGDFLDQQLVELRERRRQLVDSGLALNLLSAHTSRLTTSQQLTTAELQQAYRHIEDEIPEALERLLAVSLLASGGGDGGRATRLIHDTLAPIVRKRADESLLPGPRARRIIEGRASDWREGAEGSPLSERELSVVEPGLTALRALDSDEKRMVQRSRELRDQAARGKAIRRVVYLTGAILIGLSVAWALYQGEIAAEQRDFADLRRNGAEVQVEIATNPVGSLIKAIDAVRRSAELGIPAPLPAVQRSLAAAIDRVREVGYIRVGAPISAMRFRQDGAVFVGTKDGSVHLFTREGRQLWSHRVEGGGRVVLDFRSGSATSECSSAGVALEDDLLASGWSDGAIRIWSCSTTGCADDSKLMSAHNGPVNGIAISPDGKQVLSGGGDWTVKLTDVARGESRLVGRHAEAESLAANPVGVTGVDFHPDCVHVASASSGASGQVRIWNRENPRRNRTIDQHFGAVLAVRFSPGGERLATGGADRTVQLWNLNGEQTGNLFSSHERAVTSLAWSPEGDLVLSGSEDRVAELSTLAGDAADVPFTGTALAINAVAYPHSELVAVGGEDGLIRLFEFESTQKGFRLIHSKNHLDGQRLRSVDFAPDGRLIAAGGYDARLRVWNVATSRLEGGGRTPTGARIRSLDYDDAGRRIVTAHGDGSLALWDETGAFIGTLEEGHDTGVNKVQFSPSGDHIVSGGDCRDDGPDCRNLFVWAARGGEWRPVRIEGVQGTIRSSVFSPDGRFLVTGGDDKQLRVWRMDDAGLIAALDQGESFSGKPWRSWPTRRFILAIAFDRQAKRMVTGHADGSIQLRKMDGEPDGKRFITHRGELQSVAFNPAGDKIITGGEEGTVRISALSGVPLAPALGRHRSGVFSVRTSPDGRTIASGHHDGGIRFWRANWEDWLTVACNRLRKHPRFREHEIIAPESPERHTVDCYAACRYCEQVVWKEQGVCSFERVSPTLLNSAQSGGP